MEQNPETIIAQIEQAYQQVLDTIQHLDQEKRAVIAEYIKNLEDQKIAEIKKSLSALSNNHQS